MATVASYSPEAAMEIWHAAELAGATLVTERVELPYGVFLEVLACGASHGVLTAFMWPQGRVIQSRRHVVR